MQRTFIPEVEKIWHEDYQCDYYRGVVIDENDNIVERCREIHPDYNKARSDAERKVALSPAYSRQTTSEMKTKLEEYKRQKEMKDMREQLVIFQAPKEDWGYIIEEGIYRFCYPNQYENIMTMDIASGDRTLGDSYRYRKAEDAREFYLSRVRSKWDFEDLPGDKILWRIDNVLSITPKRNKDSKVKIQYVVYGNIRKEFRKHTKTKTITIKREWPFYNELMEYFSLMEQGIMIWGDI
jgi:hypothetical protein